MAMDVPVDDVFWVNERNWQKAELEKPFVVNISEPLVHPGTFTSHVSYLVCSSLNSEGVRRRYSDFDWLREVLVVRYHGMCVPLMPEKRVVGNMTPAFIEERMQGLENFVSLLLANPYLRLDVTIRMFLTQPGDSEFEQAKRAVTSSGTGSDPATNPGLARWFGVLRHIPLPADADAACAELSGHCDQLEQRLISCLSAITKYHEAAKVVSDSLRTLRDSMHDLHNNLGTSSASLCETLSSTRALASTLGGHVKRCVEAFSSVFDLSVFGPNEIQIFLMDGVVTDIHRIRGLKALLQARAAAQEEYSKCWVAQDKLAFEQKKFLDKGKRDKAEAMQPKVDEAVELMRRMKERVDDVSRGILGVEADRIARSRIDRWIAMSGQYAALSIASGLRLQELWSTFLAVSGMDQAACVRDAQDSLTGITSMHALDSTGPRVGYYLPAKWAQQGTPFRVNSVTPGSRAATQDTFTAAPVAAPAPSSDSAEGINAAFATFTGTPVTGATSELDLPERTVDL